MPLTCTQAGLSASSGAVNQLTHHTKRALIVAYLYYQKNPGAAGTAIPASTLISQAAAFDGAPSDSMLESFEVLIHRQAAIDAGASLPAFSASTAVKAVACLKCLSDDQLRAIEIMLKCQLA